MNTCTAFVLGGGGSHGALQVGAMRALMEAGIFPDLLVGTSIGAVNAAGLGLYGADLKGLAALERAWGNIAGEQLLDPRVARLIVRTMLNRNSNRAQRTIEEYFVSKGIPRDLTFDRIRGVRLGLIAADIETGRPVIFGWNPTDLVLEGLMASIAVPPWFMPIERGNRIMVDGGALSNIPVEPALQMGATEIYALDLDYAARLPSENLTGFQYIHKYFYSVSQRLFHLEAALAERQGVPIRHIEFRGLADSPIWDFSKQQALMKAGYEKTRAQMMDWIKK
jgi:NTE family protein